MSLTHEHPVYTGIGLDFETGGLNCRNNACTQIAMQAIRLDTFEIIGQYMSYFYPYSKQVLAGQKRKVLRNKQATENIGELMEYEEAALKYSGITMDKLYEQGADLKKVASDIIEFTRKATLSTSKQTKPVLIGQNIWYDVGFLQQLMNYAGLLKEFEKTFSGTIDFYGNFQPHCIDTIQLGRLCFAADTSITSYKLELVAERLGVELDDAHDANADVTATLNVMMVYANKMRRGNSDEIQLHAVEKTRKHFKI